jgi:carbonic anhydrase
MFSGRTQSQQQRLGLVLVWLFLIFPVFFSTSALAHEEEGEGGSGLTASEAAVGSGYSSLNSLFEGNQRFRDVVTTVAARKSGRGKKRATASVVEQFTEDSPSFMFLGCTDNRLTPASIFQAPIGSVLTQNNIGNQYSSKDTSTDAAITYAIEDLGVQHIIVLGHYGCNAAKRAITGMKKESAISRWIQPIVDFYKRVRRHEVVKFRDSRRPRRGLKNGITTPPESSDPGFRAFVEENVKNSVMALKSQSILRSAYQIGAKTQPKETKYEVYVHGFVFDETTGEVTNLNVSFGPPGMPIPPVPFTAIAKAKNFHRKKPKVNKGKVLEAKKYLS